MEVWRHPEMRKLGVVSVLLILCFGNLFATAKREPLNLTIIYSNSTNSALEACRCPGNPLGGLAKRAYLVKKFKAENPYTLLLDSGDMFSPYKNPVKDSVCFDAMNEMGYDCIAIGDQDFVEGFDFFSYISEKANFPFVCANLKRKGKLLGRPYFIKEIGRIKVGILGLVHKDCFIFSKKEIKEELEIEPPDSIISLLLPELESQCDILILLSHLGYEKEIEFAQKFPQFSIIVGGHTQKLLLEPKSVGSTLIVEAGRNGERLGKLDITIRGGKIIDYKNEIIPLTPELNEDEEVAKIVERYTNYEKERRKSPTKSKIKKGKPVEIMIFTAKDCEHCAEILYNFLPTLNTRYRLSIVNCSIDDPKNYRKLIELEEKFNDKDNEIPVIFIGDRVLGGEIEIKRDLERIIRSEKRRLAIDPEVVYFYEAGCRGCDRAVYMLNALKSDYPLTVKSYDIGTKEGKELLEAFGLAYDLPPEKRLIAPSIFIGKRCFVDKEIDYRRLCKNIEEVMSGKEEIDWDLIERKKQHAAESILQRFESFGIFGVLGAGLIDGVNPCAFATIVFFISYLAFLGRKGKELLGVGFLFAFAVFITYFAVGLGVYNFLKVLTEMKFLSKIIFIATGALAFVFAAMSIGDYFKAKKGKLNEMRLQLPKLLKKQIHSSIRKTTRYKTFLVGAFVAGILVSVLELACTGQVYLPTIIFVSGVPSLKAKAVSYLFLYNLMFIAPLVGVLILTYLGANTLDISKFTEKSVPKIKLLLAILFFALGISLLLIGLG